MSSDETPIRFPRPSRRKKKKAADVDVDYSYHVIAAAEDQDSVQESLVDIPKPFVLSDETPIPFPRPSRPKKKKAADVDVDHSYHVIAAAEDQDSVQESFDDVMEEIQKSVYGADYVENDQEIIAEVEDEDPFQDNDPDDPDPIGEHERSEETKEEVILTSSSLLNDVPTPDPFSDCDEEEQSPDPIEEEVELYPENSEMILDHDGEQEVDPFGSDEENPDDPDPIGDSEDYQGGGGDPTSDPLGELDLEVTEEEFDPYANARNGSSPPQDQAKSNNPGMELDFSASKTVTLLFKKIDSSGSKPLPQHAVEKPHPPVQISWKWNNLLFFMVFFSAAPISVSSVIPVTLKPAPIPISSLIPVTIDPSFLPKQFSYKRRQAPKPTISIALPQNPVPIRMIPNSVAEKALKPDPKQPSTFAGDSFYEQIKQKRRELARVTANVRTKNTVIKKLEGILLAIVDETGQKHWTDPKEVADLRFDELESGKDLFRIRYYIHADLSCRFATFRRAFNAVVPPETHKHLK